MNKRRPQKSILLHLRAGKDMSALSISREGACARGVWASDTSDCKANEYSWVLRLIVSLPTLLTIEQWSQSQKPLA